MIDTEQSFVSDHEARARIIDDFESTLFVEAGAGSGKTTALVGRVVGLVRSGAAELANIAAITFTEKAAAELRDRIRSELARAVGAPAWDAPPTAALEAERCRTALAQLDSAAIGTLHAFAQRLLTAHPIEAGLPPRVEVSDEVGSGIAFARRWEAFVDDLLADAEMERPLLLLVAAGVRPEALRAVAVAFNQNWDLVAERVPPTPAPPPQVGGLVRPVVDDLLILCASADHCRRDDDTLLARLAHIEQYVRSLQDLLDDPDADEIDLVEALSSRNTDRPSFAVGNVGRKGDWAIPLPPLRDAVKAAGARLDAIVETVASGAAATLATRLAAFTLDAAHARRADGLLEFHDLLVLARALLRDPHAGPEVRASLARHYQRLLLDEFQDTDPIQVELAVRLAATDPTSLAAGSAPWPEVEVEAGRLFFVGDPKQSIYRFRRADIATFLAAGERFGGDTGRVALTANFRTGPQIIAWVNHTFAALMAEPVSDALSVAIARPTYLPLQPVRSGPPVGPAVSVIGREPVPRATADELRDAEAAAVVAAVQGIVAAGWSVSGGGGDRAEGPEWRPARLGDITILIPARTSLPFLEAALDEAGIGYRAESSSLVYATRAVRDLLMVARAVDDPTDSLRVVAALRTPLLGCGDDDLFRFKVEQGGRWDYLRPQRTTVNLAGRVAEGLAYLAELHAASGWLAPSELLSRIATDRRAFELGVAEGRARDTWRRLRFVIDQARAWSEATGGLRGTTGGLRGATGGGLRAYLAWVNQQTAEGARVAEAVLPETDDDAVRIMTVHAAKGLEFPVVILSGTSTVPQARRALAEVAFPPDTDVVGYRFGAKVVTPAFAEWAPLDEQMGLDERVRLLYVAATRARDHLVVSLHRRARSAPAKPAARTNAELLVDGMNFILDALPDARGEREELLRAPAAGVERRSSEPAPPSPLEAFQDWQAQTTAALTAAARATTVSATALTVEGLADRGAEPPAQAPALEGAALEGSGTVDPGLQKRARDLDLPPWRKGRYGTAIGRAVHGVLQTIDLTDPEPDAVRSNVAAQCEAEAVGDHAADVEALVYAALGSPSVRAAAGRPHWRELYVCTPLGGRLLEGYIDLLVSQPEGLVVVDYKTAATNDPADLDTRVAGYRAQGAAYALAVGEATGEAVARVTFVFLTPTGAVERDLDDLDAAMAEVRTAIAAGEEVLAVEALV